MTKKDYERAALLCQNTYEYCEDETEYAIANEIITAFVSFFIEDNDRFDEARFRAACVPGANVKARPKKVKP